MFPPPTVAANPDKLEEVRATETQVSFLISWSLLEQNYPNSKTVIANV